MKIKEVTLFKTPLDINYYNVIDFNFPNLQEILQSISVDNLYYYILTSEYYNTDVIPIAKSIKIIDNRCAITVRKSYEDIRDFNYVCITDNDENRKFFFIDNINSENDSDNNCASSISLYWDSWANNLKYILNSSDMCPTIMSHFDRSYIEDGEVKPYIIPNKISHSTSRKEGNILNTKRVLFLVLEVTDDPENYAKFVKPSVNDVIIERKNNKGEWIQQSYINWNYPTLFNGVYKKRLIYCPIAVVDEGTNEIVKTPIFFNSTKYEIPVSLTAHPDFEHRVVINSKSYFKPQNVASLGSYIQSNISEYISKAYYSYYSPFKYTITPISVEFECIFTSIAINDDTTIPGIIGIYARSDEQDLHILEWLEGNISTNVNSDVIEHTFNPFPKIPFGNYNTLSVDDIKNDFLNPLMNVHLESSLSSPPFFEFIASFNGKSFLINSNTNKFPENYQFFIDYSTSQPLMRIFAGDKKIGDFNGYYLDNNGLVTRSNEALDDYLIRNGSQLEIARSLNTFNTFLSTSRDIFTFLGEHEGVKGAQNAINITQSIGTGVFKKAEFDAIIDDLENTPSDYRANTGENDIKYQDRVIIYSKKIDTSLPEYVTHLDNTYMYGYDIPIIKNPFSNNRIFFDFVRCENATITSIPNPMDRQIIESVLNRGVFKNHVNFTQARPDYHIMNTNLQKDRKILSNIELKFMGG